MPTWFDKLQPATWRDINFGVSTSDFKGGRRVATHEFPGKDTPFVEDLGGKAQTFSVEAFIVGDDYMSGRDKLIGALQEKGAGKLIHPYYGEKTLQVTEWNIRESHENGGMAIFTISFAETAEVKYPQVAENKLSSIAAKIDILNQSAADFTGQKINVSKAAAVTDLTGKITGALGSFTKNMNVVINRADNADSILNDLNAIINSASVLAKTPANLVYKVQNMTKKLDGIAMYSVSVVNTYLKAASDIANYFSGFVYGNSVLEKTKQANADTLKQVLQLSMIGVAVTAAPNISYETLDQAEELKAGIIDLIETMLFEVEDDTIYQALIDIKVLLMQTVPPENAVLKNILQLVLPDSLPSLVVSYMVYGDLDHEDEIISRNKIKHPGIVGGASPVEVLV